MCFALFFRFLGMTGSSNPGPGPAAIRILRAVVQPVDVFLFANPFFLMERRQQTSLRRTDHYPLNQLQSLAAELGYGTDSLSQPEMANEKSSSSKWVPRTLGNYSSVVPPLMVG